MQNNSPKKINVKWLFFAAILGIAGWAIIITMLIKKLQNPDSVVSVITILVLIVFVTFFLFLNDIKNSGESENDDDQAH